MSRTNNLYGWGSNDSGQIGSNFENLGPKYSPQKSYFKKKIKKFLCGEGMSLVLTEEGQLYTVGFNEKFLEITNHPNRCTGFTATSYFTLVRQLYDQEVQEISISSDYQYILALTYNTLYGAGNNR